MQLLQPTHPTRRKKLDLCPDSIQHTHIIQNSRLYDPLSLKPRPGAVHRAPALGTEVSRDRVSTARDLGYGFELALGLEAIFRDHDVDGVGAAAVFFALAAVAEGLFDKLDICRHSKFFWIYVFCMRVVATYLSDGITLVGYFGLSTVARPGRHFDAF